MFFRVWSKWVDPCVRMKGHNTVWMTGGKRFLGDGSIYGSRFLSVCACSHVAERNVILAQNGSFEQSHDYTVNYC